MMIRLNEFRVGTLGGMLCSIWASITLGDILQTVVMAVLGTVVSYAMSQFLNKLEKNKKK